MPQQTILLIGKIVHSQKNWIDLSKFASLKEFHGTTRQEFVKCCTDGEFVDVIALYRSNESTALTGPFDEELVSKLPNSLKFICHNGAGYDNINIAACTAKGIQVSSTPVAVNKATADIAMFLLLGALRRVHVPYLAVRAGKWRGETQIGRDPDNKLLGILGMGGIGREVAKRAKAFGLNVQYHNRSRLTPELEQGANYVSFNNLIQTSDILSLNCSLTEETLGIIGKKEFNLMKNGVVLINTARGRLINEVALVEALESGKVYSAGLDVYEGEPKINDKLLANPNVVLLPHIGTATEETQRNMELLVLENIESAVTKGCLKTQVPEQHR